MNGAVNVETGVLSLPVVGLGTSVVEANRGHCAIALLEVSRQLATGRCRKSSDSGCMENIVVAARSMEVDKLLVGLLRKSMSREILTLNSTIVQLLRLPSGKGV